VVPPKFTYALQHKTWRVNIYSQLFLEKLIVRLYSPIVKGFLSEAPGPFLFAFRVPLSSLWADSLSHYLDKGTPSLHRFISYLINFK